MFCLLGLGQFGLTILVLFCIFVLLPIYFVPSYIAFKKQKLQKTAIVVLNVFLGWTFLGWVVALVWACMEDGISAADERQANLPETLTQKTIVTASISLFAVVIFIYLSWIFRGERWNQSEIDLKFNQYTHVIEFLPQCFQEIENNGPEGSHNFLIYNTIEEQTTKAYDYLAKGLEMQNSTPKVFWANAIDVITSGGNQDSAERSQILEHKGFIDYMTACNSEKFKTDKIREIKSMQKEEKLKKFQPIAAAVDKYLDIRATTVESGEDYANPDDIVNSQNFYNLARSLAGADAATQNLIQSIKDNSNITEAEKDARIKNVTNLYGEQQVRKKTVAFNRQRANKPNSKK